jgi:hypothetical protein
MILFRKCVEVYYRNTIMYNQKGLKVINRLIFGPDNYSRGPWVKL